MRQLKGFLAAVFLTLLTLLGVTPGLSRATNRPGAVSRRSPTPAPCRREPGALRSGLQRPVHPHFAVARCEIHRVAAASLVPPRRVRPQPPLPGFALTTDRDGFHSVGAIDPDSDGGSATASPGYRPADDTRQLDLPLGVDAHPQAPVAWPQPPRGPPVA